MAAAPVPPRSAAVVAERLRNQLLPVPVPVPPQVGRADSDTRRADAVVEVVGRILAVQAQDGRGARLAVRSRTTRGTAALVDRALAERRLVVSWLNRGTLHLVRAEDEPWLHLLCAPRIVTGNARRLGQEGVSARQADQGVDVIVQAVTDDGPLTRLQLRDRLDAAGIPTAGQALVHLLLAATVRGHIVRGPMVADDHAFVSVEQWLGPRPVIERDDALARLARGYLAGHGPAGPRDLAAWAGLSLGDARRALDALAASGETEARGDDLVALEPPPRRPPALPSPRLLGPFDPILHGWASRAELVGPHKPIVTTNGLFRPIALVDGHAVATWGLAGGEITVHALEPISEATRSALEADAADVLTYLDLPPTPVAWT
jgi:hypothetical protein